MLELMVAVALAGFVTAGLYQLFSMQSKQLAFLDLQAEMHQNLRFATDVITRSVRVAGLGTGGTTYGYLGLTGNSDTMPPVIDWNNHSYGGGTDAITVLHMDPSLTMNTDVSRIPDTETTTLYFNMDISNYQTIISNFETGELLLCIDFANMSQMYSYLWVIAADGSTDGYITIDSNSSYSDYVSVAPIGQNLAPVMTCSKGQVITFYIDNDSTDGTGPGSESHPVLMMDLDYDWPEDDDVPLVDDIEDLQFAYCLQDTDCSADTSWVSTFDETTDLPWMARVSLISRSSREDLTGRRSIVRPDLEDRAASSTPDGYYRDVLTTRVTLRNLRYYSNLGTSTDGT